MKDGDFFYDISLTNETALPVNFAPTKLLNMKRIAFASILIIALAAGITSFTTNRPTVLNVLKPNEDTILFQVKSILQMCVS
jgi:hypothetical protein